MRPIDALDAVIAAALAEDLGDVGDVTSRATVPAQARASAVLLAREPGVVAGLGAACQVFAAVDPHMVFTALVADGVHVQANDVLAKVAGSARALLAAERTAVNLLCHLAGIATATAAFVAELQGTGCAVRATRKTLPGLRAAQKAAVAAGGGMRHRAGLFDALLVKDNHIAVAGGVAEATRRALAGSGGLDVQVEVDSLAELDEALDVGARSVLLDNFTLDDLHAAVVRCRQEVEPVFVEASGGITLATARAVALTGVDALAVGALTHSARALDIGLDFYPNATAAVWSPVNEDLAGGW